MRNRHLAEWRFSLFIRIVTTYPRICNVIVIRHIYHLLPEDVANRLPFVQRLAITVS